MKKKMIGSGKQILNLVLKEITSKKFSKKGLALATKKIRASLLIHGSTADESFEKVNRLIWGNFDREEEVQGLTIKKSNIFLTDFFMTIIDCPQLKKYVLNKYTKLNSIDYEAGIWAICLMLEKDVMIKGQLQIEVDSKKIDLESWINNYNEKIDYYFDEKYKIKKDEKKKKRLKKVSYKK